MPDMDRVGFGCISAVFCDLRPGRGPTLPALWTVTVLTHFNALCALKD